MVDEKIETVAESKETIVENKNESFKKESSPKIYISEEEMEALKNKVLANKTDDKEVYAKAYADIKSELLAEQKRLEIENEAQKNKQLLEELQAEVKTLKEATVNPGATRKGVSTTPKALFTKTPDNKLAIPLNEMERALKEVYFSEKR